MNLRIVDYHTEYGIRPALVADARGDKLKVMIFKPGGSGMTTKIVPGDHARYMKDICDRRGKPYTLKKGVNWANELASKNKYGVTKAGRAFINEAKKEVS